MPEKLMCLFDNSKECPDTCLLNKTMRKSIQASAKLLNVDEQTILLAIRVAPPEVIKYKKASFLRKFPLQTSLCANYDSGKKM